VADKTEKEEAAKPKSWWKAILGAVGGLLSGVVMMYVTPLVNTAVKPTKPVANFEVAAGDDLKIQFHNLSNNGDGLWDFGDGTQLLKAEPDQTIEHKYPRPGDYTVKLSLRNAFGDESERTVPVHLEVDATKPRIVSLQAIPLSAGSFAPATFKLVGRVENAQTVLLDFGDDRDYQIITEHPETFETIVCFPKARRYNITVAAINGKLTEQHKETVTVAAPPANSLTAMLTVTDEATHLETVTRTATFNAAFTADAREATCPIKSELHTRSGHTLADLTLKTAAGQELHLGNQTAASLDAEALGLAGARNLQLVMSADRQSVALTGELVADRNNKNAPLPSLMLPVTLSVQKKVPVTQTTPVATMIAVPASHAASSVTVPLPLIAKDWLDCKRTFHLEVFNNGEKIYEDAQLGRSILVTVANRKLILTTLQTNEQLRIDLQDPLTGVTMAPQ
jgi:PKD repeat protein